MRINLTFTISDSLKTFLNVQEIIEDIRSVAGDYGDVNLDDGVLSIVWKHDQSAEEIADPNGWLCKHGVAIDDELAHCVPCEDEILADAAIIRKRRGIEEPELDEPDLDDDGRLILDDEPVALRNPLTVEPVATPPSVAGSGSTSSGTDSAEEGDIDPAAPEPTPTPAPPTATDELACPECGRKSTTKQGLGRHRSFAHGVKGSSGASQRRAKAKPAEAPAKATPKPKAEPKASAPAPKPVEHGSLIKCPHCWRYLGSEQLVTEHIAEKHRDKA